MKRQDLLTNEEFVPVRVNQKFAHPKNRIKFHNDRANSLRHRLANIEKPLRKNLIIIEEILNGRKEAEFHKQYLKGKGYSLPLFTHYSNINNVSYPTVYTYVLIVQGEQVKFVKND